MKEKFEATLSKYMPAKAASHVYQWLVPFPVKLKIAKPRTSKLGDFKVINKSGPYYISVNGNLNPYAFMITFAHEVAHLYDFIDRKTLREAHGLAWKNHYKLLLKELLDLDVFPKPLIPALERHINRPKAASCSDTQLLQALSLYDTEPTIRIKDLEIGSVFSLSNGRTFELGEKRRTRFKCLDIGQNKWYLIHEQAQVTNVNPQKS